MGSKFYSYIANTLFHIVWNKIWSDGLSPGIVKNTSLFLKQKFPEEFRRNSSIQTYF